MRTDAKFRDNGADGICETCNGNVMGVAAVDAIPGLVNAADPVNRARQATRNRAVLVDDDLCSIIVVFM